MPKKPDTVSGVIIIDKHEGVTSFRIIQILKKLFDTPKVGHTGTLDPMATGVLPVLLGRAVKASDYVMAQDKHYVAELKLGIETDTEDTSGEVLRTWDSLPTEDEVKAAAAGFVGNISQVPPMYSAIKVDGQKLVDMARRGESVERAARDVKIYSLDVERLTSDTYRLDVKCSKGTYIRTLCADIGKVLGCGAAMSSLRRVETGSFTLAEAHTIEELENLTISERCALVRPTEELFSAHRELTIPTFFANLFLSGAALYQKKLRVTVPEGETVRLKHGNTFLGLGVGAVNSDGDSVIKPEKLFYLGKVK